MVHSIRVGHWATLLVVGLLVGKGTETAIVRWQTLKLQGIPVSQLLGQQLDPRTTDLRGAIVFIYNDDDCQPAGEMLRLLTDWKRRGWARPIVFRTGRIGSIEDIRQTPGGLPEHFLDPRKARIVANAFGYERTPFGLVFNDEGRAVAAFPGGLVGLPSEWVAAVQNGAGLLPGGPPDLQIGIP